MNTPYVFRLGHRPHLTKSPEDEVLYVDGDIGFGHECDLLPTEKQSHLFADALNVHEATGLTPSQLQARVAELEAALSGVHDTFSSSESGEVDRRLALKDARIALGRPA